MSGCAGKPACPPESDELIEVATSFREVFPLMFFWRTQMPPDFAARLRAAVVIATGTILFFPSAWLVWSCLDAPFHGVLEQMVDVPFLGALKRSLVLMGWVLGLALAIGWPLGVLAGTYKFRCKNAGFLCLAVP